MSSSNSKLPAIILGVVVFAILVAFYIAGRSSHTDMSGHDDTHEPSGPHSGYSGSLIEYLNKY